jgi:hypothetical protein
MTKKYILNRAYHISKTKPKTGYQKTHQSVLQSTPFLGDLDDPALFLDDPD